MKFWYQRRKCILRGMFWPLSWLFRLIVFVRKALYQSGMFKTAKFPVPVIVVGNITTGGTGKTPLLIALSGFFQSQGYNVGIVSRGYGGKQTSPHLVTPSDPPTRVGDEALLILDQTDCPVVIARKRAQAVAFLLEKTDANLILSDDGLQHYAMARDIEIAVVDGQRLFGNRSCLPAGPLREPISRLKKVDFVVVNGGVQQTKLGRCFSATIKHQPLKSLIGDKTLSLQDCQHKKVHALAGIGHPHRFFDLLESMGLTFKKHVFPDHYLYKPNDIDYQQADLIIMTQKDAVKCIAFADERHYYLPITLACDPAFLNALMKKVKGV